MEIHKRYSGGAVELKVTGRLDGYWSDHLARTLDEEIHQGSHHLRLDLSEVGFLSSAGIGILVKFYQALKKIQGSFSISKASERVSKTIELCGLKEVLLTDTRVGLDCSAEKAVQPVVELRRVEQIETPQAIFDVHTLEPEAGLTCCIVGLPGPLEECQFGKENCRTLEFPDSTFAIGLGALGQSFEECRCRFGEFIAVAGAVAYLPTDGTNVPDYLIAAESALPDVQVCYGVACHAASMGGFSKLLRFETKKDTGPVTLAHVVESCLDIAKSTRAGIVIVAETAGLIGAALRRSPTQQIHKQSPLQFPQVREWLSFSAEPAHTRSVALIAGIALREHCEALGPVLRPLDGSTANGTTPIASHFHAAAFSYRPLQKGAIDLNRTVRKLFEEQTLESVLHLLNDNRPIVGAGQSEFIRGACWIGTIQQVTAEAKAT